jgi:hypothetical protein
VLQVVLREFQISRAIPIEIDRAKAVNDADRVQVGLSAGRFGENLVDELVNAANSRVADDEKTVAFGKPANFQAIRILARIEDYRSVLNSRASSHRLRSSWAL